LNQKNKHYCINYGGATSCGRVKAFPHTKIWKGVNLFDDKNGAKFDMYVDGVLKNNVTITGELRFMLKIWKDKNEGFVELIFEWWDNDWDRALAFIEFNGEFECGDKNQLLFDLWFEKAAIVDFTNPNKKAGEIIDYPDKRTEEFIGFWMRNVNGLGLGTPKKGSAKPFTGKELQDVIKIMMPTYS